MKVVKNLICCFCGKNQSDVKKLIAGPSVEIFTDPILKICICDECVDAAKEIVDEERKREKEKKINESI